MRFLQKDARDSATVLREAAPTAMMATVILMRTALSLFALVLNQTKNAARDTMNETSKFKPNTGRNHMSMVGQTV